MNPAYATGGAANVCHSSVNSDSNVNSDNNVRHSSVSSGNGTLQLQRRVDKNQPAASMERFYVRTNSQRLRAMFKLICSSLDGRDGCLEESKSNFNHNRYTTLL
jgi:hypothetical protein